MSESTDVLPDGRLRLDREVALPELLDVLIVGGGPAGTAVAFRAKELGLSALVIELDDILKRIRDYDKAKPIKPDFGAAKQMGFPKGGALIERLHFFSDIQGDDLCAAWKVLYRRYSVPARIGTELVGMEPGDGGTWRALVRNHRTDRNEVLNAKHVVLALGAGMPRRLDVPGDVRAISYRLTDAKRHVGAPACVIGGGVSAAEAVIAISEAKVGAGDNSSVYWSYRGQEMPKVPQALHASMWQAISVARNVRLLPGSEAQEIVEIDGRAVLLMQIGPAADGARATAEDHGTPVQPSRGGSSEVIGGRLPLMEFQASHAVACIGQEIDWSLMNDVGIFPVAGGAQVRKAIPLNALLECRQPNVYVIGDTLNPSYLECDDFDGDVSEFRKITHRGNIKTALIDGVRVADVISQRLVGQAEVHVDLEFVGADTSAPRSARGCDSLRSRVCWTAPSRPISSSCGPTASQRSAGATATSVSRTTSDLPTDTRPSCRRGTAIVCATRVRGPECSCISPTAGNELSRRGRWSDWVASGWSSDRGRIGGFSLTMTRTDGWSTGIGCQRVRRSLAATHQTSRWRRTTVRCRAAMRRWSWLAPACSLGTSTA